MGVNLFQYKTENLKVKSAKVQKCKTYVFLLTYIKEQTVIPSVGNCKPTFLLVFLLPFVFAACEKEVIDTLRQRTYLLP